jgi:hypothetical protein
MSPAKTLFRDIAKQVHPDLNGGTVNANKMMQEAIKHRNNGDMLLNLARKWGLNINGSFDEKVFNNRSKGFDRKVFDLVVGAIVNYGFIHKRKMKTIQGVLFKIRNITRGRLEGAKEYSIYDFRTQTIWKHKTFDKPRFKVVGMASPDELQEGRDTQQRIKNNKKERDAYYNAKAKEKFRSVGIKPNKNYEFHDMMVLVNYKTGPQWKKLLRTTAKCAFVEEYKYHKPRMIKIRSILDAR